MLQNHNFPWAIIKVSYPSICPSILISRALALMCFLIQFNSILFVKHQIIHISFLNVLSRSRIYFITEKNSTVSSKSKHLVTGGEEKLLFHRKKPPTEPGSGWAAVCLDWLGLGGKRILLLLSLINYYCYYYDYGSGHT